MGGPSCCPGCLASLLCVFGFQLQAVSEPKRVCTFNIIFIKLIEGFHRAFSVGSKRCFLC